MNTRWSTYWNIIQRIFYSDAGNRKLMSSTTATLVVTMSDTHEQTYTRLHSKFSSLAVLYLLWCGIMLLFDWLSQSCAPSLNFSHKNSTSDKKMRGPGQCDTKVGGEWAWAYGLSHASNKKTGTRGGIINRIQYSTINYGWYFFILLALDNVFRHQFLHT